MLADPETFTDGPPHELLAELRRTTPVAWQEMDGQAGFYAVLTHADVVEVARHPTLYSASAGGVVLDDLPEESLGMMRNMLLAMDPPRHQQHRKPLADSFKAKAIAGLEPGIRAVCRELMAEAAERRDVEFVNDVAAGVPTRVIGRLMGIPEADWAWLHRLAQRQTSGEDPDIAADGSTAGASVEMAMYAIEFAARRRAADPQPDLTRLILDADFGGAPMSDVDFGSFFVQLVTAGNDTTKTMLSSGLVALLAHPDQLADLRADRSLVPGAVEEILRWANPLHYFRRTTAEDTVLHDVAIPAGSKVAMYYTSANRDEVVFERPQAFDIRRRPNRHLAFGVAEHYCLGVHLARLEGVVFFEELLSRFSDITPSDDPIRLRSTLNNGYKRVPVTLRSRDHAIS